jgi:hypothetical protein
LLAVALVPLLVVTVTAHSALPGWLKLHVAVEPVPLAQPDH